MSGTSWAILAALFFLVTAGVGWYVYVKRQSARVESARRETTRRLQQPGKTLSGSRSGRLSTPKPGYVMRDRSGPHHRKDEDDIVTLASVAGVLAMDVDQPPAASSTDGWRSDPEPDRTSGCEPRPGIDSAPERSSAPDSAPYCAPDPGPSTSYDSGSSSGGDSGGSY